MVAAAVDKACGPASAHARSCTRWTAALATAVAGSAAVSFLPRDTPSFVPRLRWAASVGLSLTALERRCRRKDVLCQAVVGICGEVSELAILWVAGWSGRGPDGLGMVTVMWFCSAVCRSES